MIQKRTTSAVHSLALCGVLMVPFAVPAEDLPGNRYNRERNYASDISVSKAFVETVAVNGTWGNPSKRPLIIDVRTLHEYAYGHPKNAINIPYPNIYMPNCTGFTPDGVCLGGDDMVKQSNEDFVAAVQDLVRDKDRPIYTLCRTGSRSIAAANLLEAAGYTNVHNIWEGFVGQYKSYDDSGPMDVDNSGTLTDNDKDGWRYYAALPYETKLLPNALYQPYAFQYFEYARE